MIGRWEEFKLSPNTRTADTMRVSLNKRAVFSLNRLTFEALDEAKAVILFYDKVNELIGMRPSSPDVDNAYPLKRQGKSNSFIIRAKPFVDYYGLKIGNTIVFKDIEKDADGILVLDTKKTKEVAPRKQRSDKLPEMGDGSFTR